MRTVRFLEGGTGWPYIRQTPNHDGVFGNTRFLFGPGKEPADWLAVLNAVPGDSELAFPRERTIFFSGEPPTVRKFDPRYLDQFGRVVTVDRNVSHPGVGFSAPALPWHIGIASRDPSRYADALTFAQLAGSPAKTRLCSCICSTLSTTRGHRARRTFVKHLRRAFCDRIDFFGRGVREVADKEEAVAPYRFHIAIENAMIPDYWTEKLGDAFLRNCFPIYAGAPNISDYFDPNSMAVIDISQPKASIRRIAEILDSDLDRRAASAISEAKRKIMWEHNLLARIDSMIEAAEREGGSVGEPRYLHTERELAGPGPWYLRAHAWLLQTSRRLRRRLNRRN